MKLLKSMGLGCVSLVVLVFAIAFVALFVGSMVMSSSNTAISYPTQLPMVKPISTVMATTLAPSAVPNNRSTQSSGDDGVAVTIVVPGSTPTVAGSSSLPTATMTPSAVPNASYVANGSGGQVTMDYPLTVTAQSYIEATKVNAFYQSVDATRTAAAARFATWVALTAAAPAAH